MGRKIVSLRITVFSVLEHNRKFIHCMFHLLSTTDILDQQAFHLKLVLRKHRLTAAKWLAQGHRARKWHYGDSNLDFSEFSSSSPRILESRNIITANWWKPKQTNSILIKKCQGDKTEGHSWWLENMSDIFTVKWEKSRLTNDISNSRVFWFKN